MEKKIFQNLSKEERLDNFQANAEGAGTPYFFKQWGHWIPEDLWPEDFCLDMSKVLYVHDHNENYYPIGTKKSGSQLDGQHHKEFPL